jgi:hypothetical protein
MLDVFIVSCWPNSQILEATHAEQCSHRRESRGVHIGHPRISHSRSLRARRSASSFFPVSVQMLTGLLAENRQRVEGSARQTHHAAALATCDSGGRRARHARASYDRWWWRVAIHPQELDRGEGWRKEARRPRLNCRSVMHALVSALFPFFFFARGG